MNTKLLQEQLMRNIKRSLNEAFAFESDPVGDDMLKVISKNENIAGVVKDASEEDWKELVNKIKELATNGRVNDMKMPAKITNIDALARAFVAKMDVNNVNMIKKMEDTEIAGLVDYLNADADADEVDDDDHKSIGGPQPGNNNPFAMESKKPEEKKEDVKECGGADCKAPQQSAEKKEAQAVKESRLARRHTNKKLNESKSNKGFRKLNEMRTDRDAVLGEIYQHMCDCQDLAEEIGEFGLMDKMEEMRHYIDTLRF